MFHERKKGKVFSEKSQFTSALMMRVLFSQCLTENLKFSYISTREHFECFCSYLLCFPFCNRKRPFGIAHL
jgi:hypothetical protein